MLARRRTACARGTRRPCRRATDLRRQLDGMRIQLVEEQNLRAVSEEALAEMEAQLGVTVARDRMQVVEHNLSKIKTFEGGRYTAPLRLIYMRMLSAGASYHAPTHPSYFIM
jgi:hypothetical protein